MVFYQTQDELFSIEEAILSAHRQVATELSEEYHEQHLGSQSQE